MVASPPTSVLLPTVRWTPVIEAVATQLRAEGELLVVCDRPDDPVARRTHEFPAGVRLVVAGEPTACSGKANAIAAGMAAASHDRIVWTDDDFDHPPDWLDGLQADYERHGPVSEVPVFVGRDPLSVLFEPLYLIGGTLGTYADDKAWGGAVVFERDDLADSATFLAELRQTVSDDGLLSEYLDVTTRRRTRRIEIGGSIRETVERHVRFVQIVHRHEPNRTPISLTVTVVAAVACLLAPLVAMPAMTVLAGGVAAFFGVRRWTVLLAGPATLLGPVLFGYALARRTFVWGGRRYRWPSTFDVEIVGSE